MKKVIYAITAKGIELAKKHTQFHQLTKELEIDDDFELSEDAQDKQSKYGMSALLGEIVEMGGTISKDELDARLTRPSIKNLYVKRGMLIELK